MSDHCNCTLRGRLVGDGCHICNPELASELAGLTGSDFVTGVEREVCDDIAARQKVGIRKYGTTVADNPLRLDEWLQHAYEETLDQAIYLKRAINECRKNPNSDSTTPVR